MCLYATIILFITVAIISPHCEGAVVASEDLKGECSCKTEMTLNIPACVCSGFEEAVIRNQKLRDKLKEVQDKCNSLLKCKKYIYTILPLHGQGRLVVVCM